MLLGYVRVSSAQQGDGTSPEEQHRRIQALAAMRGVDRFDVVMYEDIGVSGSVPLGARPSGERLLSEAKAGDVVAAVKLDRLFRSAVDALETVRQLKERGVEVILIDLGMDPVASSSTGRLFFGLLAQFAEFERERIRERTADGREAKRNGKGHVGGEPPYGFRVVGSGKAAHLIAEPAEEAVIETVRHLAERGANAYRIGRELARRGMTNRRGGPFLVPQVQRILARAV